MTSKSLRNWKPTASI